MNRNDEQFDEFLRSQFKQKTFEMKDQYWKNAQQMIATHRTTAGQGLFNVVLSAVVLVGLSAGLLWNTANTPSAANTQLTSSQSSSLRASGEEMNREPVNDNSVAFVASTPTQHEKLTDNHLSVTAHQQNKPTPSLGKGKQTIRQEFRTRKSVLATQVNSPSPEITNENVISNQATNIIYIDGKLFKPSAFLSKTLSANGKKDNFLVYATSRSKGFMTLEGGFNSYNNLSSIGQSLNFHTGIRYYRFVTPSLAISTGLSYSRLQQNMDARNYESIDYGFGQTKNETRITTLRLDYIELPLSVHYRIKGNHFLQAGATVAYAIQSNSLIESTGNTSRTDNGYMDGINRWDVQFNAGYSYLLDNKYVLSASYYRGMMDISAGSTKADYNNGFRLTVGYKLF